MFKLIAVLICVGLFGGCSAQKEMAPLQQLKQSLAQSQGCEFDALIVSQSEGRVYQFTLHCIARDGALQFEVVSPESIKGIGGTVAAGGGKLRFEDVLLAFPLLADGDVSPVIAPWLFMDSLQNGLVRYAKQLDGSVSVSLTNNFRGQEYQADVELSRDGSPDSCQLYWDGRCLLRLRVEGFRLL